MSTLGRMGTYLVKDVEVGREGVTSSHGAAIVRGQDGVVERGQVR